MGRRLPPGRRRGPRPRSCDVGGWRGQGERAASGRRCRDRFLPPPPAGKPSPPGRADPAGTGVGGQVWSAPGSGRCGLQPGAGVRVRIRPALKERKVCLPGLQVGVAHDWWPAHSAGGGLGVPARAGVCLLRPRSLGLHLSGKNQFGAHRWESSPAAAQTDTSDPSPSPPGSPQTLPGPCGGKGPHVTGPRWCRLPTQPTAALRKRLLSRRFGSGQSQISTNHVASCAEFRVFTKHVPGSISSKTNKMLALRRFRVGPVSEPWPRITG